MTLDAPKTRHGGKDFLLSPMYGPKQATNDESTGKPVCRFANAVAGLLPDIRRSDFVFGKI